MTIGAHAGNALKPAIASTEAHQRSLQLSAYLLPVGVKVGCLSGKVLVWQAFRITDQGRSTG